MTAQLSHKTLNAATLQALDTAVTNKWTLEIPPKTWTMKINTANLDNANQHRCHQNVVSRPSGLPGVPQLELNNSLNQYKVYFITSKVYRRSASRSKTSKTSISKKSTQCPMQAAFIARQPVNDVT